MTTPNVKEAVDKPVSMSRANTQGYGAVRSLNSLKIPQESDDICPDENEHYPFLDITRIACVSLVAIDHGASKFGSWDVLFSQSWVLQYLFLVCGVCYGMSKKPLSEYLARLALYAVAGIAINWSAWLLMGLDWRTNFFNVIFHIWFIFGLMIYSVVLSPVRGYLLQKRRERDAIRLAEAQESPDGAPPPETELEAGNEETRDHHTVQKNELLYSLVFIGGGILFIMVLFHIALRPLFQGIGLFVIKLGKFFGVGTSFWGLPQTPEDATAFVQQISDFTMTTTSNIYLIYVCPHVIKRSELTAWLVFINTYLHRLLFYRGSFERPWHGMDLMMLALVTYFLGLYQRRTLGKYLVRYWFVVLLVCALIWPPGTHARLDEQPPTNLTLRIESNSVEAIFIFVWLAAGERLVQKEIFTEDRLSFMNDWALLVFLVHKAVHIMLPSPINWCVLVALIPVCYLRRHGL